MWEGTNPVEAFHIDAQSDLVVCCLNFLYVETKLIVQLCWLVADAGKEFKGNLIVLREKNTQLSDTGQSFCSSYSGQTCTHT